MRPLVLLDVDGVLGDFATPCFEIGNGLRWTRGFPRKHPADLDQWDIARFLELDKHAEVLMYEEIKSKGFHNRIEPYPGAIEGVGKLREVAEVHIVTSPMFGETWCSDRWHWLHLHFGIKGKDVTHSHRKELVRGDALIDDKPSTIVKWQAAYPEKLGILWDQSWNRAETAGRRVSTWEGAIALLKERI